ncbi:hypothetical protein VTO42DRAFT_8210 [Malbranchea cinnamomea]
MRGWNGISTVPLISTPVVREKGLKAFRSISSTTSANTTTFPQGRRYLGTTDRFDQPKMATIPSLQLNDGNKIPILAYGTGTAWLKRAPGDLDQSLIASIKTAIDVGYHHLDGAEMYNTERELGVAIKESGVPREKLFVTTKLHDGLSASISDIRGALDASLKRLGLEYVDLYLIHSPFFAKSPSDLQSAWREMEAVKKAGKARSIGVSNFLPSHLESILQTATIVPAVNQVEYHPYLQHSAKASDGTDFLSFHKKHGIALASYGPLTPIIRAKGGPLDPLLERLAKKYGVGEGEVLLRWVIDRGAVGVTTSSKQERLKQYLSILNFELTSDEVEEIAKVGGEKHVRNFWQKHYGEGDRS